MNSTTYQIDLLKKKDSTGITKTTCIRVLVQYQESRQYRGMCTLTLLDALQTLASLLSTLLWGGCAGLPTIPVFRRGIRGSLRQVV